MQNSSSEREGRGRRVFALLPDVPLLADVLRTLSTVKNRQRHVRRSVPLGEHVIEVLICSGDGLEAQGHLRLGQAALATEAADVLRARVFPDQHGFPLGRHPRVVDLLDAAGISGSRAGGSGELYGGDFLEGLSIASEEFESWRREESARCKGQALVRLQRLVCLPALDVDDRDAMR